MNPWDSYCSRIESKGGTKRGAVKRREARSLTRKYTDSLAYHTMMIDGVERNVAVIDTDNFDTKTLCSMPGEDLPHGGMVEWLDYHWIITARDANNELYTRVTMRQCNHLLRWVSPEKDILQRWSIVEDGTTYLIGEYSDKDFVTTRGDSRVTLILPRDKDTVRLGRDNRFIIDDEDAPNPLAYRLTKPFKLTSVYGGNGIVSFTLMECNTEESDDLERHIANYYNYFPQDAPPALDKDEEGVISSEKPRDEAAREVWF
jgi:hypothetical protein